jgi:hypothetical protein
MNNVHANTCSNVQSFKMSCATDNPCPRGTQCCQEVTKDGNGPITCCAEGSCNSKLGHCSSPRTGQPCPNKGAVEGYSMGYRRSESCMKWKYMTYVLLASVIVLLIAVVSIKMKNAKSSYE